MASFTVHQRQAESKSDAEALIPQFKLDKILNQDQNGRRITLLGTIAAQPALLTLERAAFPSDPGIVSAFLATLTNTINLGANDVYRWYMSNHPAPAQTSLSNKSIPVVPDLKLNLIYPASETHVRKYTAQRLRYVTETADIYRRYIRPFVERTQRTPKRLDWIYNVLDGITEQEDVIYRSPDFSTGSAMTALASAETGDASSEKKTGFILLPDLNWDRTTISSLHLLALVERRDVWSLRDLRKSDIPWLRSVVDQAIRAAAEHGTKLAKRLGNEDTIEPDEIKCYVHYHPTYFHFHIHLVHVMLEPEGTTQSVGKAIALENLISWLESLPAQDSTGQAMGLDRVDVSYFLGEQSEIWKKCFARIKGGEPVDLLD